MGRGARKGKKGVPCVEGTMYCTVDNGREYSEFWLTSTHLLGWRDGKKVFAFNCLEKLLVRHLIIEG